MLVKCYYKRLINHSNGAGKVKIRALEMSYPKVVTDSCLRLLGACVTRRFFTIIVHQS
jgi:hypothetical protein